MRLTKAGMLSDPWPGDQAGDSAAWPRQSAELLRHWHSTLDGIDDEYIFCDLLSLLRAIDDIDALSPLLACDVAAFIQDADRAAETRDERPIRFLEVRNVAEPTRYESDPSQPDDPWRWMDDDEAEQQDRIDAGVATLTGGPGRSRSWTRPATTRSRVHRACGRLRPVSRQ